MQEKERERKGKNGKIVKIAGCSPYVAECCLSGRTPHWQTCVNSVRVSKRRWESLLQIFLHRMKAWLNGRPGSGRQGKLQSRGNGSSRTIMPIFFDWMNHLGRAAQSDMQMQTLDRQTRQAVKGWSLVKNIWNGNDFIIEKQKAELQRMDAANGTKKNR